MNKILIIDDDPKFLKVAQYIISGKGYGVTTCSSGEEALELIESNKYMVIISDYKMGRISGLTIARATKIKNPSIIVIILTAYAGGFPLSIWGQVPDLVIAKPVDWNTLVEAIRNLESISDERIASYNDD